MDPNNLRFSSACGFKICNRATNSELKSVIIYDRLLIIQYIANLMCSLSFKQIKFY